MTGPPDDDDVGESWVFEIGGVIQGSKGRDEPKLLLVTSDVRG